MLAAGSALGPYTILGQLGAGGMGEVYRARDTRLGRDVAIKVLPEALAADRERRLRFAREARATAALAHPNILVIYDVGEHEGAPYLAMELLQGETLRQRLKTGPLSAGMATEIAIQIARGLVAAGDRGIVHRDLKPENVFLTRDGVVKILDFGLARLTHAEPCTANASQATTGPAVHTHTGQVLGTAGYLSPEQVRGEPADARSDVFALGCVLYEMLSGRRPFSGESAAETLSAILRDETPPIQSKDPRLPPVESVARRCLAKRPAERYQTAREVSAALEALASQSARMLWGRGTGLSRGPFRVAASVVLLILALGAVAMWQGWGPLRHWFGGSVAPARAGKGWILVAEFEGPPDDSTLAPAARSLLSAALDQSELMATVSQDQIQQALVAAGKPANSRVDGVLARELAYRSAVNAVLEGVIGRIGSGYSIVLRVVDADNARMILTRSGTARDEDGLIPALGDLAAQLRKGLGENQEALQATRPMDLVATPSFEAYRFFVKGMHSYSQRGERREAIRFYQEALALDPGFASAWSAMFYPFWANNDRDSALICTDEALKHPERLTPRQRSVLPIMRAMVEGDMRGALALLDRMLMENPEDTWALATSSYLLKKDQGRFEEAFDRHREAMRLTPFGPNSSARFNDMENLTFLGRLDEAREVGRQVEGVWGEWFRGWIEILDGQPAAAESLALANLGDPNSNREVPGLFQMLLGHALCARGALEKAAKAWEEAEEEALGEPPQRDWYHQLRLSLSVLSDGLMPMPEDVPAGDMTATGVLTEGLQAAVAGDMEMARRCLDKARSWASSEFALHGAAPALLEAYLEIAAGRPQQSVRLLQPIARKRVESLGSTTVGLSWVRWVLADAFEELNQPDSAAVYLERICDRKLLPPPIASETPWVHGRLALLYARGGRLPDAERHLAALEQAWDRPDATGLALLERIRAAVGAARSAGNPRQPARQAAERP